jgi:methyl-accepting chemotaxis protein
MFIGYTAPALRFLGSAERRLSGDRRAAARDAEAHLATIEAACPILQVAFDGRVLAANTRFLDLVASTAERVVGRPFVALLTEAERESERAAKFRGNLATGQAATARLALIGRDGREIILELAAQPVSGSDGTPVRLLILAHDVTALVREVHLHQSQIAAIDASQAVIEFALDGRILRANPNFLAVMGYTLEEIAGRHHSILVDPAEAASPAYREFWARLGRGEYDAGQYRRLAKGGREVWIQASYNPVFDSSGKPSMVVKYATDITSQKLATADFEGQLAAIAKSQAVIEFSTDGRILNANANFLSAVGYALEEVRGQHHGIFVDPATRASAEYRMFWEKLGRGEYDSGVYKRIAKGGREIWIQASYNPIMDLNGKPFKVVKYATDITAQKLTTADFEGQLAAIGKSQAVIEFSLDGRILTANPNFLSVVGYTLEEVRGNHHSMFVDPALRGSVEYRMFWEKLGRGEYDSGRYKRLAKGGREVWIQASYNPILDLNGKPFKVVKYATDITAQVLAAEALAETVRQVQAAVRAAEQNDLTKRVPLEGKSDDIAVLCSGLNGLLDTMVTVVTAILEASETISTGAREIAMGNTDLSQRTEEQASSLEQTAASLGELTSTVRQNADNAQQANKLAISASDVAVKGGSVVAQVVRTMDDIATASRKISDIIGVIDEIAFQTNILALNAAVEAARAGEQGRGFAVVAAEVRNLAQRSANAAKEIKSLIADSGSRVEAGSKLVATAGNTMEEIVTSVKRVSDIMAEISAASKEQSSGIDQVNIAVSQMDKITQQNAALVEQAAAAAKSMEEQTIEMSQIVGAFQIGKPPREAARESLRDRPKRPPAGLARPPAPRKPAKPARDAKPEDDPDDWKEF